MAGISVGSVSVDVVPSAQQFVPQLRAQISGASAVGDELGRQIGQRVAAQVGDAVVRGVSDGAAKARGSAASAGQSSGGAFADAFKARVTAALRDLPNPAVGLDATELDAELADIRARLGALSDVRVGVDLSADAAMAELDVLRARLDELGARSPKVDVQVDVAKASAELAAISAEVDALGAQDATVQVEADTSGAQSGISSLLAMIAGLGPALIPIGAAATVGLSGIATAAGSGAAGLGVLALGYSSVSKAVGLLGKEHTQAATDAASAASRTGQSAQAEVAAAAQVTAAQRTLTQARANARNGAISAAEAVANAQRTAATQEIQAAQQVAAAQYAKVLADQQETTAQQALNDAREQAARDLEAAANRAADAQLSQQQATIDVANAQSTYSAVLSNGSSTELQREQAALDLAKARQALVEANQTAAQSEQDNSKAQRQGVDGAPAVVSAAQALAAARHGQAQATQQLTNAERAQATQAVTGAQAVSDAVRAQAAQQRQSAASIESAQAGVASAMRAVSSASRSAGSQGAAAMQAIRDKIAKVNPEILGFAKFITGTVEPAFNRLKTVAALGLIPGVESGLKAMAPLMPSLSRFVGGLAKTMGDLAAEAGKALTGPFWRRFFDYIQNTAGPTIVIMAHVIGNLAKGFAGLLEAFAPVTKKLGDGILSLSGKFATLSTSRSFANFLSYVEKETPKVAAVLGEVVRAVGHLLVALAPIGAVALSGIGLLARIINAIPTWVLTQLLGVIAAVIVGLKVWSVVQAVLNLILDANPLVLIAVLVGLFVLAIIDAYRHSQTFRDVIEAVWQAIQAVISGAWNDVIKPVFHALATFFTHTIPDAVSSVIGFVRKHWPLLLSILAGPIGLAVYEITNHWHAIEHAFSAAWNFIGKGVKSMWSDIRSFFVGGVNGVITILDDFIKIVDKVLGFFHLPKIPEIAKIATSSSHSNVSSSTGQGGQARDVTALATGGILSPSVGPGFMTNGPRAIVGEGNPNHPEYVIPTDPQHRGRALALFESLGGQLLAGGGILGWAKHAVSGATHFLRSLAARGAGAALHTAEAPAMALLGALPDNLFKSFASHLVDRINTAVEQMIRGSGGSGSGGDTGAHGIGAAAAQKVALGLLPKFGWGGAQMQPLIKLWNAESGWRWDAGNPTSGAYGIPQALPASKMAAAGADWRTNPLTQIMWGLGYIKSAYGSPARAYLQEETNFRHFPYQGHPGPPYGYDQGGLLEPGLSLVYNGTGAHELVAPSRNFEEVMSGASGGAAVVSELHALRAEVQALRGDTQAVGPAVAEANDRRLITAARAHADRVTVVRRKGGER